MSKLSPERVMSRAEKLVIREYNRLSLLTIIVKGLDNSDQSKNAKFIRKDLSDALDKCINLRFASLPT